MYGVKDTPKYSAKFGNFAVLPSFTACLVAILHMSRSPTNRLFSVIRLAHEFGLILIQFFIDVYFEQESRVKVKLYMNSVGAERVDSY